LVIFVSNFENCESLFELVWMDVQTVIGYVNRMDYVECIDYADRYMPQVRKGIYRVCAEG